MQLDKMTDPYNSSDTSLLLQHEGWLVGLDKERSVALISIELLTLCFIWVLSVTGNMLVYIVINRSRRMQSTTNYFVVSLAFADLSLALVCVPFISSRISTNRWIVGSVLCKVVRFVQYLVPCTNMYVLVAICIDRFYTIIYPLSFKVTRGTAKRLIAFSWSLSSLLCCFNVYFFEVRQSSTRRNTDVCPTYVPVRDWSGIMYTLCLVICQYIIPLAIVAIGYTRVFKYIWKGSWSRALVQRTMNPVPRTKVKMVKMLIVVTYTTCVSYAPFYITQLWFCFDQNSLRNASIFIFASWLIFSTGVTKPIIYLCYNSSFRRGCKEVFCMSTMKCYRSNTYAITNVSSMSKKNHVGMMDTGPLDSPCRAFNRAVEVEKSTWPLSGNTPMSYM